VVLLFFEYAAVCQAMDKNSHHRESLQLLIVHLKLNDFSPQRKYSAGLHVMAIG
jgi:hypothetical protein